MITVAKQENGVLFTFTNSDKYLYGNGTIEVPFNTLSIIQDESDMITFRKSASNDIFISARYDDMGYASKEDAVNALKGILFAESEGGGGSVDPDEVRTIVEEETSGMSEDIATLETNKFDGASYNSANHTIVFTANGVQKATIDASDFIKDGMVSNVEIANNNLVITFNTDAGKSPISIPLTNFFDPTILDDYFTKSEVNAALSQKLDVSAYTPTDLSQYWTSAQTQNAINEATSGIPSSSVIEGLRNDVNTLSGVVDTKLDASAYTPTDLSGYYTKTETDNLLDEKADLTALTQHTSDTTIHVTSAEKAAWNNKSDFSGSYNDLTNKPTIPTATSELTNDSNFVTTATTTPINNTLTAHTADTTIHVTSAEKTAWNAKQDALTAVTNIAINNNVISADLSNYFTKSEVTTALADKMDVSGMSAYATTATTYSKTEVDNAITAATSTKQDTLVSGTNIKTINGESILGSGDVTIEGGGAGLDDDTQQLISTAFNDLNDRKADLTELTKYQKKGDYVVTSTLSDYVTNDAFDDYVTAKERIISGSLNDLNERLLDVISRLEALENA